MALFPHPKKVKKGQKQYWHIRFRVPTGERDKNGNLKYKNLERSIGQVGKMTKAQAQDIHDRERLRIKGEGIVQAPTLSEFSHDFIKQKRDVEKIRSVDRYIYSIKQLSEFFGRLTKLDEITPKKIDEYKARRLNDVSPGTVNRELQCLRAMINLAAKWNQFRGVNPVSKAGTLKEVREELKAVTYEEEDKLLAALNPNVARIIEFAPNTGMRIGEIIKLELKAIDYSMEPPRAKIAATEQKGKRFREVPLNERALQLIDEAMAFARKFNKEPDVIFLNTKGKPYKSHDSIYPTVIRACKKAGIRKINPHLLRHTFITRAIESGKVDPIAVKEVVGHADIKTLLRYVHLRDSKVTAVNSVMRDKKKDKSVA